MKLISFVVPCYNSQEYMRHCIDTLLPGGDQVEILLTHTASTPSFRTRKFKGATL